MTEPVAQPIDPDVDLHVPAERAELRPHALPVLAAISAGGMLGSAARYGLGLAWPHPPDGFPWATFGINVSGCLLIGVLMVIVNEVATGQRLLRPFVGVGVLGGYTTFSTYVVEAHRAATAGRPGLGLLYLGGTLVAALLAVFAGAGTTTWLVRRATGAGR
ncbi:CrcB family protein [Dactylosporangium sp. NPDC005572]|uniref:fluoride efflux transporter FluC n=1 Tax=Dactylosporangium sp. NPDC005572 TaxID=3156889 RepID=UPI0033B7D5CC